MKKWFCLLMVCAITALSGTAAMALPNPVVESSFTEVVNTLGFTLAAPGAAEDISWSVIDGKLAQARYSIYDVAFTLRAQASDKAEDISGLYFASGDQTPVQIVWCDGQYQAEADVGARIVWYDATNGVAWSLSCENAAIDMEILAGCARESFLFAAKGAPITLEGNPTTGYQWDAMNFDLEALSVSAPIYEMEPSAEQVSGAGGTYTFVVAGAQPGSESDLTLLYYRSWEGLGSAVDSRDYHVTVDGDYNVTLEETTNVG